MSGFTFKQFDIEQDACAMKVGTDGVLLGAWCAIDQAQTILDIGTGTGLLALMVAQRNATAIIDAIEIDESAATQANTNVSKSQFAERIHVYCISAQAFAKSEKLYDAIVCNPPYFIDSLLCPNQQRTQARHCQTLTYNELLESVNKLLTQNGKFSVIIPANVASDFVQNAEQHNLKLWRVLHIFPTLEGKEKRQLLTFTRQKRTIEEQTLTIEVSRHVYTSEYKELTKDFYLNF